MRYNKIAIFSLGSVVSSNLGGIFIEKKSRLDSISVKVWGKNGNAPVRLWAPESMHYAGAAQLQYCVVINECQHNFGLHWVSKYQSIGYSQDHHAHSHYKNFLGHHTFSVWPYFAKCVRHIPLRFVLPVWYIFSLNLTKSGPKHIPYNCKGWRKLCIANKTTIHTTFGELCTSC